MQKPAYSVTEVLAMIGISRSKFYQLVNGRQIKVRKIGNRTIILAGDLEEFFATSPLSETGNDRSPFVSDRTRESQRP